MSIAGIISGSVSTGTLGALGSVSLQQTDSIIDWACDAGWTINGNPSIGDTGTITITGNHSSFSFREGGAWTAVSTTGGAQVNCQDSVSVLWDNTSLGGSFSGTVTCNPGGTFSVSGTF